MSEKVKSFISGDEKLKTECYKASELPDNLLKLIQSQYPGIQPTDFISIDEVQPFRRKLLEKIIEEEISEMSRIEEIISNTVKKEEKISRDIDKEFDTQLTFGEKLSDKIAAFGGSWRFIILFGIILFIWITINLLVTKPLDPFPFILLNLLLSTIAALQAPVIMMSQNRQETKDRLRSRHDYMVNLKAEIEISSLNEKLDRLLKERWTRLLEVQQIQFELMQETLDKIAKKELKD